MPTKLRVVMAADAGRLHLTEAGVQDVARLARMEALCFSVPWNEAGVRGELESNPFSHAWLLRFQDEAGRDAVAGYAFMWETFETAQIARIGILPEYRRQGLGAGFLDLLKNRAARQGCEFLRLEVRASNQAAIGLYEKAGMLRAGRTKQYYSDGEDALIMALPLESEETTCL